nr:4-hydroxythreonine-4-phosphate dehydrogenase PdxA [Thiomonas sp. FB-6]
MGALEKPLAISMGDAAGIGPEIIVKAYARGAAAGCVVYGCAETLARAAARLAGEAACARAVVARIERPGDGAGLPPGVIPVLQAEGVDAASLRGVALGHVDARAGAAAHASIIAASRAALRGEVAALVTAPIHKEALHAAGVPLPGHTEILQDLCGGAPVRMMLANDELRTVLVTIHLSVRRALEAITEEAVLQTLRITHAAARAWGLGAARIAVAGLNPHAGEGGLFGDEEARILAPAIGRARAEGIDASGPYAPDTVFMRARNTPTHPGAFDVVVAMLHDHALIPVKYLGLEQGVNITLGLPFVRTSPDHGTAFDIAGRGVADEASLCSAIAMARRLAAPVLSA